MNAREYTLRTDLCKNKEEAFSREKQIMCPQGSKVRITDSHKCVKNGWNEGALYKYVTERNSVLFSPREIQDLILFCSREKWTRYHVHYYYRQIKEKELESWQGENSEEEQEVITIHTT